MLRTLFLAKGQPQGIAPTNRHHVGAILYGCPSLGTRVRNIS